MYDAVLGAPVRQNSNQFSVTQCALTFELGQQSYADPRLSRLNENAEIAGRDLRLDRARRLLPARTGEFPQTRTRRFRCIEDRQPRKIVRRLGRSVLL